MTTSRRRADSAGTCPDVQDTFRIAHQQEPRP